jgi:MFS transporter, DHA1 family, multidrug resistance protein
LSSQESSVPVSSASSASSGATGGAEWRYIALLALLLGAQPVATDLYLPALPALAKELGNPSLTMTLMMLCFGIAQLFWGPLSDRFGRRPILIIGTCGFAACALLGATANSMTALVIVRSLQGIALAAIVVCARATVRDLYLPVDGMRVLSKGLSGLGVIALLSPLLGAGLATMTPWRGGMVAIGLFGFICLAWILWTYKESRPHAVSQSTVSTWSAMKKVLQGPRFRAWTALSCASYGTLFCFLLGSSFVYINVFGFSPWACGGVLALNCVFYIAGTYWCRWLLSRFAPDRAVRIASVFSVSGGAFMLIHALIFEPAAWAMIVGQCIFSMGHGVNQPCGQAGAIGDFPEHAGQASALSGFCMMVAAFVSGQLLAQFLGASAWPLILSTFIGGSVIALAAWTVVRRTYALTR